MLPKLVCRGVSICGCLRFFCTGDLNTHQILKRFYNPPKSKDPLIQIQPLDSADEAAQSKGKRRGWEKTKAGSAAVRYWSMDLTSTALGFSSSKSG